MKPYIIRLILTIIILIVNLIVPNNTHADSVRDNSTDNSISNQFKSLGSQIVVNKKTILVSQPFKFNIPSKINVLSYIRPTVLLVSDKNEIIYVYRDNDTINNRLIYLPSLETVRKLITYSISELENEIKPYTGKIYEKSKVSSKTNDYKKILKRLKKCPLNGNNLIIERNGYIFNFFNIKADPFELVNTVFNTIETIED